MRLRIEITLDEALVQKEYEEQKFSGHDLTEYVLDLISVGDELGACKIEKVEII